MLLSVTKQRQVWPDYLVGLLRGLQQPVRRVVLAHARKASQSGCLSRLDEALVTDIGPGPVLYSRPGLRVV